MTEKGESGASGDGEQFARLVADVYELSGRLREEGERIAAGAGQTQARWQLMSVVSERPLTVPQAARRLGITRQGAQRTANDLLEAGLATLVDNPDHQVSKLLELTAAGREALAAITAQAAEFNARLEGAASPRELAAMRRTIAALLAALD
jgi:DNA-binding MarR family transcriptional regulator